MKRTCPQLSCLNVFPSPDLKRYGRFYRKSDSQWIRRYRCTRCGSTFSGATGSATFGQNKRRINDRLRVLLCSGVSQRRSALILKVHRKTVVRKFRFLAEQARLRQRRFLMDYGELDSIQFDDLETSEHSKCKPLSVTLAVDAEQRTILGFKVSVMPAKGHLAALARKKYGFRPDKRPQGIRALLSTIRPNVRATAEIRSDRNPLYPGIVRSLYPKVVHHTVKGRRGCVAGQGELKKIGFDPLFSLNHTCAMLRANVNRLFRRTWCTTKKLVELENHLAIYMDFHNRTLLTKPLSIMHANLAAA